MKIVKSSASLHITKEDAIVSLKKIERCGRLCYKSEDRITDDSYIKFLSGIIKRGHLSVIEHGSITVIVTCDRGVSHEIVRHRIGSYSQESTRYVNYSKSGITYIQPDFKLTVDDKKIMKDVENHYKKRIKQGLSPERARYFLMNGTKTEIAMTYNLRQWRHFFDMRGNKGAHPDIRLVAIMILSAMKQTMPVIFDDLEICYDNNTIVKRISE